MKLQHGVCVLILCLSACEALAEPSEKALPSTEGRPTIVGIAREREVLVVDEGVWRSGSPLSFEYQWLRCADDRSLICPGIRGENGKSHQVTADDAGSYLRVLVTARNKPGFVQLVSEATARVAWAPPINLEPPVVAGTGRESEPLDATLGAWEGKVTTLEPRWYRCNDAGCAPLGVSIQRYTPDASDVGAKLSVEVVASGPGGAVSAPSNEVQITAMPPVLVSLPEIQGTPREGEELVAFNGNWQWRVDRFEYQWFVCDARGEACSPASGGTEDRWTPGFADVGATLRVLVRATGPGGIAEALSPQTSPVLTAPPRAVTPPVISGEAREHGVLHATVGQWDGTVDHFAFQWFACDPTGAGCSPLQGEDGDTLTVNGAWSGRSLRVEVTASGPGGSATSSSGLTTPVIEAPPTNTVPPAISGFARDGEVLTANAGSWTGTIFRYRYSWQRCDSGGSCETVGRDDASYRLVAADVGARLTVEVTAISAAGMGTATSAPTRAVEAVLPRADQPPSISGVVSVGQMLSGTPGAWSGTGPVALGSRWLRCDPFGAGCAPIPGAVASRYVVGPADVGASLRFEVVASNRAGSFVASSPPSGEVMRGYDREVLTDAPLGYWRFGEGGGATARDASGHGIDGTVFGGATLGVAGALPDGDRAARFDGVTGRVHFGDQFDLPGSSPFTFEAWIRPTVSDEWHRRIVEKEEKNAAGAWEGYRLAINSSLGVYCQRWQSGNNGGQTSVPMSRLTLGNWYHVACTFDGTSIRMYLDGVLVATRASAMQVAVTSAPFTVGSFSGGGSASWFAGDLDEVAVYGSALLEQRLRAHVDAARAEAPLAFAPPAIEGQVGIGRTLSGTTGTWRGGLPIRFAWQWLRCDGSGSCVEIPGATGAQYKVSEDDANHRLQLRVMASNVAGSSVALSVPTTEVAQVAPVFVCVEAEAGALTGSARVYAGPSHTHGGTVVLGAQGTGSLSVPFEIPEAQPVTVWARVRAQNPAHDALRVSLSEEGASAGAVWEIPVTPVLRWQKVRRESSWPGVLSAGAHALVLSGEDPGVEIDAVCVTSEDSEPPERFAQPPVRTVNKSVRDFGAVGDGVADDTAALQAALDALNPGDALLIPSGRYRFTSTLTLNRHEVSIVGEGSGSVLFADFPAEFVGNAINVAGGYEGANWPLLADAFETDREVLVAAGAPFQRGDALMLSDDEWGPTAPNLTALFFRNRAHLVRVMDVRGDASGKVLTLDRPLQSEFTLAHNARAQKFNGLREVVLANFNVEGTNNPVSTDNADTNLILVNRCDRCFLTDLELRYARKSAVELGRALDTSAVRVRVSDATATDGGGHGYGVAVTRSQGVVVRDSLFTGVIRHGVPISWGSRETFVFQNVFDRSAAQPDKLASVDIHGQDDYGNLVEDNLITGGDEAVVIGGGGTSHGNDGPWNVIRRNRIENAVDAISVFKSSFHAVIEENTLRAASRYAVRIESGSHDALIRSNVIEGSGAAGVWVNGSDRTELRNNLFAPAAGPAIQIRGGTGYVVHGNTLGGGLIVEPGTGTVENNF